VNKTIIFQFFKNLQHAETKKVQIVYFHQIEKISKEK